jgi:hypothetical protein
MADTETIAKPNRASRRAAASDDKAATKRDANPRGIATIDVAGVKRRVLLRMDTLADLEDAFEVQNLQELESTLQRSGTREFGKMLAILVNAAEGEGTVSAEECRRWPLSIPDVFATLHKALLASGAQTDAEADAEGK